MQQLTWFKDARRTFGEPTSVDARTNMSPTEWWIMYGTDAPTVRKLAIKVLSQTASSSACERNWSTFALIHTKQRNKLAHSSLEKLVYCYYNMKLQIRDNEAEIDHVDRGDPLDVFDIVGEDDDTEGNQLFQWIRPLHLDDDEGNPAPRVAEEARNEGINVERVLEEEVRSSSTDSLEELLRPRPRNTGIPPSSNPTQPQHRADTNDSSSTRSGDSPTTGGGNDEGHSGAGGSGGGYGNYYGPPPPVYMSPFTGEANFMHATQDDGHGSRRAGPGIGAIGKYYTRRERGKGILSSQEDDSLSRTSDSIGLGSSNYGYTHNQPFPYPSYPIPMLGWNQATHGNNPRLNLQMIFLMDNLNQSRIHMGGMLTITCKTILGIYHLITTLHNTLILHVEMMKIVKILNLIETLCGTKV
ncbi:uncharacterized protein LOC126626366 [Malus sylvestris]|uniref:uncharacterized protein LOC126626366 n=1 Tax=Malus sylvestris TaxID=3752 RepID=UPI0021ABEFCC|nr:uncharacterized protein LOC126626366 [Malus sylvestris]